MDYYLGQEIVFRFILKILHFENMTNYNDKKKKSHKQNNGLF